MTKFEITLKESILTSKIKTILNPYKYMAEKPQYLSNYPQTDKDKWLNITYLKQYFYLTFNESLLHTWQC